MNDLIKFKDIHRGKRGFILSCGPSLNDINLSLLDNEIVFGTSLAYKSSAKIDYHFMGDYNIASQFYSEILTLTNTWFVSKSILMKFFLDRGNMYYFEGLLKKEFSTNLSNGRLYGGGTSTFLAMQFAYWMGITELYCLGLDHYKTYTRKKLEPVLTKAGIYNRSGMPLIVSQGKDKHHFSEDFYGEGVKYFLPTINKMKDSYIMAREAFEFDGRKVYNASTETALPENILPRISFEEII